MAATIRRLPRSIVAAIHESKIIGVRAGARSDHRFTGVWAVVVEGRVFARSWSVKPGGWYRTFLDDARGAVQVAERLVRVRAVPVRSERLRAAIEHAYTQKYTTPASQQWVRGFRSARRRQATLEFTRR